MAHEIADGVPRDNPGAARSASRSRSATTPAAYCSTISQGNGDRTALIGPAGTRSYAQLCEEACRWGNGFVSLGLTRGDRVLLFLDDTPAYPAAFFGAVRAGFVPLLINTLTPPDLLQFYLADSGATVAVVDAEFCARFDAEACKDTALATLIIVNGAVSDKRRAENVCRRALAEEFRRRTRGGRHPSQRDGVLDVFVGLDRPAQGHRASAARHALQRRGVCQEHSPARTGRHLLLRAENLLRLWIRQFHHLPVLGRRDDAAAAGSAEAGRDLRGDRSAIVRLRSSRCRRSMSC